MYFPYDQHLCFLGFINNNILHKQQIFRLQYSMIQKLYHPEWNIILIEDYYYTISDVFNNHSTPFDEDSLLLTNIVFVVERKHAHAMLTFVVPVV